MPPISNDARPAVKRDYAFGERFRDQLAAHTVVATAERLMREATEHQDYKEHVDDVHPGIRLARTCRRLTKRSQGYRDLTIRSWRKSGAKTTMEKLRNGDAKTTHTAIGWTKTISRRDCLIEWAVFDMDVFMRQYFASPDGFQVNDDQITGFHFWHIWRIFDCVVTWQRDDRCGIPPLQPAWTRWRQYLKQQQQSKQLMLF